MKPLKSQHSLMLNPRQLMPCPLSFATSAPTFVHCPSVHRWRYTIGLAKSLSRHTLHQKLLLWRGCPNFVNPRLGLNVVCTVNTMTVTIYACLYYYIIYVESVKHISIKSRAPVSHTFITYINRRCMYMCIYIYILVELKPQTNPTTEVRV